MTDHREGPTLEVVLTQLTVPDNETIAEAEALLARMIKESPHCLLPDLTEVLQGSTYEPTRLMASSVMKRTIKANPGRWHRMPLEMRSVVKEALLGSVASDPSVLVQHHVSSLISSVAKYDAAIDEWPRLFELLFESAMSGTAAQRGACQPTFSPCPASFAEDASLAPAFSLTALLSSRLQKLAFTC